MMMILQHFAGCRILQFKPTADGVLPRTRKRPELRIELLR
jgi:hypothetical protein